ncbi:hypothetical protein [Halobellus ordinarius]|uniref:hypothetical protein n=1 Tax=Halobellus ordinarius TaxID=3075120 RepID=UPI0028807FD8|nr:hypothetical protein [Halobellus sp. ZY16]
MKRKTLFSILLVFAVVASGTVGTVAAAGYGMNAQAENHPDTWFQEDELTIESHDQSSMDWLEYEGDNGDIKTIDAHVNGTDGDAKVAYRADQLEADALGQFPRYSDEENNTDTWLNTSQWTSTTGVTVSDTDGATAAGVPSIEIASDGSFTDGTTGNAEYTLSDPITSDVEKLYLQSILNVDTLDSGAVVEVQVRDGDGDYVNATIDSSATATAEDTIANQTANGVIYQRQLGQFAVEGNGDGSLDAVETVRVEIRDGDGTVTMTGLNVQKKSRWDFGEERVLDTSTDDDDDYTSETVRERPMGGEIEMSSLQGLGEEFSSATIHKLTYLNVEYRLQDKPDSVSMAFTEAKNYPGFPTLLDLSWRRTIPTAYDISHGNLELKHRQTFMSERYIQIRYAEGVGETSTDDIADSSWIDLSSSLGEENTEITADSTVQPDTTYVVEFEVKLLEDQVSALEKSGGAGGFWGSDGGGGPFSSLYNWVAGGVVGLLSMLGIKKRVGA